MQSGLTEMIPSNTPTYEQTGSPRRIDEYIEDLFKRIGELRRAMYGHEESDFRGVTGTNLKPKSPRHGSELIKQVTHSLNLFAVIANM